MSRARLAEVLRGMGCRMVVYIVLSTVTLFFLLLNFLLAIFVEGLHPTLTFACTVFDLFGPVWSCSDRFGLVWTGFRDALGLVTLHTVSVLRACRLPTGVLLLQRRTRDCGLPI